MSMGPKLFAAFGAGALFASAVLFFAGRQETPVPAPSVPPVQSAPAVTPVAEPAPTPEPAKPDPKPVPSRRRAPLAKAKVFRAVLTPKPSAPTQRTVNVDANLPAAVVDVNTDFAPPFAVLPPREPQTVTIKPGTLLQVRLGERLASDRNVAGDTFIAALDQPLVVDGWVIAERGARIRGHVAEADQAGRIQGVASLALQLDTLTATDGQRIQFRTASFIRKGESSKKDDAVKVGISTAIGAAIGAAVGGGKGAAIGAASGGAAGAGTVLATRGKPAVLENETRLSFRIDQPVTISER